MKYLSSLTLRKLHPSCDTIRRCEKVWLRKPRAVYFWSWRDYSRSLLCSLKGLCQLHAHFQWWLFVFSWCGLGRRCKSSEPGQKWGRLAGFESQALWPLIFTICPRAGEWNLVYSLGNVLGLTHSYRSAWIGDLVLIKSYSEKQPPSNCYFLVVRSRIVVTIIKPSLPIGLQ